MRSFAWRPNVTAVALVLFATLAGLPLRPFVTPTNLIMLYLVAVMITAVWLGKWAAVLASLLSVIIFDLVFVPPYYTLAVADTEYLLTFAGLLAVGLVISTLAARAQEQAQAARRREAQTAEQERQARLLEETEKLQTTLLNSISHDLRTPLASITGSLSSLLADAALLTPAAQHDLLHTAWEETLHLNRLVGNLLEMTRLESGALKVVRQPYEVEELVGATLAHMPNRLQGRLIKRTIPPDLPPVAMDLTFMIQALVNLVDNAIKYAPPNQPVEIVAYQQDEMVLIAVKDRGPGLPEAELEHVFSKFYRLNPAGAGGTGLGLSIVRGIVEAHHGRVWAENRPGGGAIFTMALPVASMEVEVPVTTG